MKSITSTKKSTPRPAAAHKPAGRRPGGVQVQARRARSRTAATHGKGKRTAPPPADFGAYILAYAQLLDLQAAGRLVKSLDSIPTCDSMDGKLVTLCSALRRLCMPPETMLRVVLEYVGACEARTLDGLAAEIKALL